MHSASTIGDVVWADDMAWTNTGAGNAGRLDWVGYHTAGGHLVGAQSRSAALAELRSYDDFSWLVRHGQIQEHSTHSRASWEDGFADGYTRAAEQRSERGDVDASPGLGGQPEAVAAQPGVATDGGPQASIDHWAMLARMLANGAALHRGPNTGADLSAVLGQLRKAPDAAGDDLGATLGKLFGI